MAYGDGHGQITADISICYLMNTEKERSLKVVMLKLIFYNLEMILKLSRIYENLNGNVPESIFEYRFLESYGYLN